jgi:hypothetical protein
VANDAAQDDNAAIDNASVAEASICQRIDDQPSVITSMVIIPAHC